ncbi:MAG: arylsulfatase [Candidatus Omnitrophota bacterium]
MNPSKNTHLVTRRTAIKAGAAAVSFLLSPPGFAAAQSGQEKPHILFLMADQFRGDCLSADGHPAVKTPNLDRIASEGILFRRAYSSTPTCTPARSAILSGLSPWRHGMLGYGQVADRYNPEMPQAMRDAGYYTLGVGKMHWHPQRALHGFHQTLLEESGRAESVDFRSDYRSWFYSEAPNLNPDATGIGWNDYQAKPYELPENFHPTHWMGETAIQFLQTYNQPQPFFLKVSFARPHSPYDPPERFMKMFADAPIPNAVVGEWAERHALRGQKLPDNTWRGDLGEEQVRRSRQGYYGSIAFIDEQIGRILEALDKRGWLDRTLIVFTSDHGDMTGDHNLWRKSYPYEPSARIPMLMRWPAGLAPEKRGRTLDHPVELRDLLPTFLDAASVKGDFHLDGDSLLKLARDENAAWRKFIDLEHDVCYSPENHWNALTDGRYKYVFHARDGEEQLFNLTNDPGETRDLALNPAHHGELRQWRNRMIEHLAQRGEEWVKNGTLVLRPKNHLYSPNFPARS